MSAATPRPDAAAAPPAAPGGAAGRVQRSLSSWLMGLAATGLTALVGFFATPLLVRWLGDAPWGAWTVIGEWLGYLGLTQLAMGPGALAVVLLRAHTGPDPDALTATAKRGVRLYVIAAAAVTPVALALAWWAPRGLPAAPALAAPLRWAVGIAAMGSLLLAPSQLFRSLLETVQRSYLVRAALLAQSLLITALSLWWVWLRWGLVGIAAANFAGTAVGAGLWLWMARPWLRGWRKTPAAPLAAGELWRYNWPLLLAMLGNQINALTDATVVGLRLGAAAVTGFALTQSLLLLAGSHLGDVGAVSWAGLGEMRARSDPAFGQRIVELAASVLGVGMVLMATLAAFDRPFVTLWVGARHFDGAALTWATAGGMAAFGLLVFFSWLIDTQGDARRRLWSSSIGAALNLGLSLWLVRRWGVAGVAVGTLAAYLATDAWYLPRLAVRLYGLPGRALLRALVISGAWGGLWAVVMAVVAARLRPAASWVGLALELVLAGALAAAYCWVCVLRPADRNAWRARLAGLAGSIRA